MENHLIQIDNFLDQKGINELKKLEGDIIYGQLGKDKSDFITDVRKLRFKHYFYSYVVGPTYPQLLRIIEEEIRRHPPIQMVRGY